MSKLYNCTGHNLEIPNVINGDGIYLFDDKKKRYMDLESGVWCTSLGHKNAQINKLIKKQIDSIMHTGFCYSNNILEQSADSVLSIVGFVRFPPRSLIENIINIVRAHGGKIIANEVTTGIGRTGKWFGYNYYQIEPDMVAIGKGIGNGYPVSVTAINSQTIKELEKTTFKYSQSHQNDPLGAAIVNEVIKIIKDNDLISKAKINSIRFLEMLQTLKDGFYIIDVRGRGLMFAIDLSDENIGNSIYKKLIHKGYIICNRKSLFRIDPPLTINENEFENFVGEFKKILESQRHDK